MTTIKHSSGLTEPDKKVLPMSSDICYPSLRYVQGEGWGEGLVHSILNLRFLVPFLRYLF